LLGEEVTQPTGIAVDSAGNTYVTGQWVNGSGSSNFATIRYDSAGKQKWVRYYNGPAKGNDGSNGVAVDSSGNVYVTGSSENDYGSDSFATVRYDSAGKQQWAKRYSGPTRGSDRPSGIAVDSSGNTYLTGISQSGEQTYDFATVKYDSSGKQLWAKRHARSGSQLNYPVGLAVSKNSVYVGGSTRGGSGETDLTVLKYDSKTGKRAWAKNFNSGFGPDNPAGIAADQKGNAYLTGWTGNGDFLTVKYDSSGKLVWTRTYNGPGQGYDYTKAVAVDSSGYAYVTGQSLGAGNTTDFATIKYGPGGKRYWVQRFDGKGKGADTPAGIAVDSSGNVYVTGQTQLGSGEDYGFATVKYDSSGKQTWVTYFSGP